MGAREVAVKKRTTYADPFGKLGGDPIVAAAYQSVRSWLGATAPGFALRRTVNPTRNLALPRGIGGQK